MTEPKNAILVKMLDRLFAGLASGPNLNCRPHSSRQRVDWTQISRLQDVAPAEALCQLLSKQATHFQARVAPPKKIEKPPEAKKRSGSSKSKPIESGHEATVPEALSPEEQKERDDWVAQQSLLTKLRGLAEDAREYEQDTGVHVLHVGFPLLSLPPGVSGSLKSAAGTKRLLAPITFVSVSLSLRAGPHPTIAIEGLHDGADFLVPNEALFAWLERQTGKTILPDNGITNGAPEEDSENADNADSDRTSGETSTSTVSRKNAKSLASVNLNPWTEVNDLVRRVAEALQLPFSPFTPETLTELRSAPRADVDDPRAEIVPAAVLGLFPMNNQGLLRDMQAMVVDDDLHGPVQSFLTIDAQLDAPPERTRSEATADQPSMTAVTERLVSMADPCQARAVRLAREHQGLVVHGPPGTGKSQTITNMIGDHLVRGERVLLVCDKRTALDVVARRLEHLGLGSLCALIHDPQHDQRSLYKQVKEQLEGLTSTQVPGRAQSRLEALDRRWKKSRDALSAAWSLVMQRDPQRGVSFHERMGEWLEAAIPVLMAGPTNESANGKPGESDQTANETNSTGRSGRRRREKSSPSNETTEPADVSQFHLCVGEIADIVNRAAAIQYADQPWRHCTGISLSDFLQWSKPQLREVMVDIVDSSRFADETSDDSIPPLLLPEASALAASETTDDVSTSFPEQGRMRGELADRLGRCLKEVDAAWRSKWAKASRSKLEQAQAKVREITEQIEVARSGPLDSELLIRFRSSIPPIREIIVQGVDVEDYLVAQETWYAWIAFRERSRAAAVLRAYGLTLTRANAQRLHEFLVGVSARLIMGGILEEYTSFKFTMAKVLDDESFLADWDRFELLLEVIQLVDEHPSLSGLSDDVRRSLSKSDHKYVAGLEKSVPRAESLEELRLELNASGLFLTDWLRGAFERLCHGKSITVELEQLDATSDKLLDILRIHAALEKLPTGLRALTVQAIASSTIAETAVNAIRHQVLSNDIAAWLKSNPDLQALDGKRLNEMSREMRQLQFEKQTAVRDLILDIWIGRQRERLLAMTGSRLSSLGADLRRRLTTRGERAMRLRQVISLGARIEAGDPLFDLRPVWMASPETVAQIFPRDALFDVVIFDEASQCRLEEALPVLTRAKRVVIAGDPKQLPPTRFFESGVITSDNVTVETEQDLFEAHQSEIEDLLTAALSLDIQESYLDVHYRSRNSDLVEFSNEQFYSSRLQAIPGHPKNRIRFAPITLYHVEGVYEERTNHSEAQQVCQIVADLLRRAEPPSIGIACFNLTQRDLILEKLDEMANEDNDFASRLAAARSRVGEGAFEGLFVKNLENVQGDERDHMIISTTYGRDKEGRFYRRFGPLGQAGGGRRLNVLITRARDEVHLVTSIPRELYRALPPVPNGQQPGGGWLLFAYLAYAEQLAEDYRDWRDSSNSNAPMAPRVLERPSSTPSHFAREVAHWAASQHHLGSDVHWGNDGFCVDIAFHHPSRPDDRTLGLLVDGTRFRHADDPVEWDLFRTAVLEGQGWELARCWTPEFFRDPEGCIRQFVGDAARIAKEAPDPEAIPVK